MTRERRGEGEAMEEGKDGKRGEEEERKGKGRGQGDNDRTIGFSTLALALSQAVFACAVGWSLIAHGGSR